jgi:hypothetical protein
VAVLDRSRNRAIRIEKDRLVVAKPSRKNLPTTQRSAVSLSLGERRGVLFEAIGAELLRADQIFVAPESLVAVAPKEAKLH